MPIITSKPSGVRVLLCTAHFSTTTLADSGHNWGKLDSCIGLHSFSWCPPGDAKNVMCLTDVWSLSWLLSIVHEGTNWKIWQSCRGGTCWGVCGTPRLSCNNVDACIGTPVTDKTQLRHLLQLKIVGSDHRDAPGMSLPVHASNGLNPRRSQEQNPPPLMCSSFYTQKVTWPATCVCNDIINDIIMPKQCYITKT